MRTRPEKADRQSSAIKRSHLRDIRTRNRARLLGQLLQGGAISRRELSERTGLTQASVSRITKELIAEGICHEGDSFRGDKRLGRRRVEICVDPKGGSVIAICLSAFSRRVAVTDLLGRTAHQTEIPGNAVKTAEGAVDFIGRYVDKLVTTGEVDGDRVLGAALAIAGSVDHSTGNLVRAPLLKWRNDPIRERLTARLGVPVRVENIADALCYAFLGPSDSDHQPRPNIFLVHVAVGMGASLAIDGRMVGRRGDEGWIGNIPAPGAFRRAGEGITLSDVSSGRAILARIETAGDERRDRRLGVAGRIQAAVAAANASDGRERQVFMDAGKALGESLMRLTVAYLPDRIVLAGPVAAARQFCEAAISSYREAARGMDSADIEFTINRARYIDAAENLALREYVYSGLPQIHAADSTS